VADTGLTTHAEDEVVIMISTDGASTEVPHEDDIFIINHNGNHFSYRIADDGSIWLLLENRQGGSPLSTFSAPQTSIQVSLHTSSISPVNLALPAIADRANR